MNYVNTEYITNELCKYLIYNCNELCKYLIHN